MDATILTLKDKEAALARMQQSEGQISAKIEQMIRSGALEIDEAEMERRGCGDFCGLLRMRRPRSSSSVKRGAQTQSHLESSVFGRRKEQQTANDRLARASESAHAHARSLSERAETARSKARALASAGKRSDALLSLKRAKAIEKQVETAQATAIAIEAQRDMLDGQELQREVAQALAASVSTIKSKGKGLLKKTETAVDDMEEMREAFDEVGQVLGGLAPAEGDDDELAAELDAMLLDDVPVAEGTAAAGAAGAAETAETHTDSVLETLSQMPAVPKKREERRGLLKADSALENQ